LQLRAQGVQVRAVAPIVVEAYIAWCQENGEDPEEARASYAADRMVRRDVIWWPPSETSHVGAAHNASTRSAAVER